MTITNTKETARPTSECKSDLEHVQWDFKNDMVLVKVDKNRATWFKHDRTLQPRPLREKDENAAFRRMINRHFGGFDELNS